MNVDMRSPTTPAGRGYGLVLFGLFFCSGFSSLLYQVVWVRMAFAQFGVITPVLSVVLSVFMLGLGLGALLGGGSAGRLSRRMRVSPAYFYGAAELLIGLGAFAVPALFGWGEQVLLGTGAASSTSYLVLSALIITGSILPWCVMMGTTFPLMMAVARQIAPDNRSSFSFLYLANVIGAMTGTIVAAVVLVEALGFAHTTLVAALVNFAIAAVAFAVAWRTPYEAASPSLPTVRPTVLAANLARLPAATEARWIEVILLLTGFSALAMEVVWTRAFTFVLKTTIYAFAMILATYLLATWIGSALYRLSLRIGRVASTEALLGWACCFAFVPAVLDDPRLQHDWMIVLASIAPFCAVLGYLTPKLVDAYAGGDPMRAGWCYSTNILGGILGPLVAGYALLPFMDVRLALVLLAVPFMFLAAFALRRVRAPRGMRLMLAVPVAALLVAAAVFSRSYEEGAFAAGPREVHRDHVASAVAYGVGMDRGLLVNGIGITSLTPLTKIMADLPLAAHAMGPSGPARDGLVICFGMGTTFRTMHSWGIETTVVDLTQSVIDAFGFFHADAAAIEADPHVHVVADDGRRFLLRTNRSFDVIVLDPPPPVEAAGSSLLYSTQFYEVAKRRLRPGGILQQWLPDAERAIAAAVAKSLVVSFPYVQVFRSRGGYRTSGGFHFLASMTPIPTMTAATFVAQLPEAARRDLLEWNGEESLEAFAQEILSERTPLAMVLPSPDAATAITDDRPFNEYYVLRRKGFLH